MIFSRRTGCACFTKVMLDDNVYLYNALSGIPLTVKTTLERDMLVWYYVYVYERISIANVLNMGMSSILLNSNISKTVKSLSGNKEDIRKSPNQTSHCYENLKNAIYTTYIN